MSITEIQASTDQNNEGNDSEGTGDLTVTYKRPMPLVGEHYEHGMSTMSHQLRKDFRHLQDQF